MNTLRQWYGQRFKAKRLQKNWSQDDVAEYIGVKRTTYANYEQGKFEPTLIDGLKICKLLEIDPRNLPLRDSDIMREDGTTLPGGA